MSLKSILIISIYTVSKSARFSAYFLWLWLYLQCSGADGKVFKLFSTPRSMTNCHTWPHSSGWLLVSCCFVDWN